MTPLINTITTEHFGIVAERLRPMAEEDIGLISVHGKRAVTLGGESFLFVRIRARIKGVEALEFVQWDNSLNTAFTYNVEDRERVIKNGPNLTARIEKATAESVGIEDYHASDDGGTALNDSPLRSWVRPLILAEGEKKLDAIITNVNRTAKDGLLKQAANAAHQFPGHRGMVADARRAYYDARAAYDAALNDLHQEALKAFLIDSRREGVTAAIVSDEDILNTKLERSLFR